MQQHAPIKPAKPKRIKLTDQILDRLNTAVSNDSVPALAKRTHLPYGLVYNIVHKRVKSISARHYRMLFGESPPSQDAMKVDGTFFREMVDLWLFLNDGITKSDLHREFSAKERAGKVDYRIFSGHTATIDPRLEKLMQAKFSENGIDLPSIRQWIGELKTMSRDDRVPYARIRPALLLLHDVLKVHPTFILNQLFARYESGELKSVSKKIYRRANRLKSKVESAMQTGGRYDLEQIKEEIYGAKKDYTLYSKIVKELKFLQAHARISPKRYLGRSANMYDSGKAKRITTQRAVNILKDCEDFINRHPELPLAVLPPSYRKQLIKPLIAAMVVQAANLLSHEEGIRLEKQILRPSFAKGEYEKERYGFTQFDRAPTALGMKKRAFDLMVAKNCEIFRGVGRYARKWYLSDLYLKELAQKDSFELVTAKYELLAESGFRDSGSDTCML